MIIYIIAPGRSMSARRARSAEMVSDTVDVPRSRATSAASGIESAKRLADSGEITADEFERLKAKAPQTMP